MASHSFKFDPNAGTSQGVNLVINTGANFKDSFTIQLLLYPSNNSPC